MALTTPCSPSIPHPSSLLSRRIPLLDNRLPPATGIPSLRTVCMYTCDRHGLTYLTYIHTYIHTHTHTYEHTHTYISLPPHCHSASLCSRPADLSPTPPSTCLITTQPPNRERLPLPSVCMHPGARKQKTPRSRKLLSPEPAIARPRAATAPRDWSLVPSSSIKPAPPD